MVIVLGIVAIVVLNLAWSFPIYFVGVLYVYSTYVCVQMFFFIKNFQNVQIW